MEASIWTALSAYAAVVVLAAVRSRQFGIFALVILGFPTLGLALRDQLGFLGPALPWLQVLACIHFATLILYRRMRPAPVRWLLSVPALWYVAATFLAFPWALSASFGGTPYGAWVPFALATAGLLQSVWTREETLDVRLDNDVDAGALQRWGGIVTRESASPRAERPLRIVQITDPHLGPFMSVARLRRICRRAVEREPDLILITGDLMTMESHDVDVVTRALEPLAAMRGRVFACHGNHDLEARDVVRRACATHGIRLLVDEAETVDTPAGRVQLVGADFVWRGRDVHLQSLAAEFPRERGALRVWLLHDPGAFKHLPQGDGDLVLSGHTHGGQVGLLSFGLKSTFVSMVSSIPDHGMWARGRDRLYVHRAQGVYGFPVRLGVPGEQSLMRVFVNPSRDQR